MVVALGLLLGCGLEGVCATSEPFIIVIDAGHGGHDSGALGKKSKEKDINLGVALKLGKMISGKHRDVKVVYTRSTDKFVELRERANIANRAKADLFVSIHANSLAHNNKSRYTVRGASTYTLGLSNSDENLDVAKRENSVILMEEDFSTKYEGFDPSSTESYIIFEFLQDKHLEQSVNFASAIQQQFVKTAGRADRGVRQAGFWVLHATSMPAVLVELDFISNPTQEQFMVSSAGQTKLATSIYNAFASYKQDYDRKQSLLVANPHTDEAPTPVSLQSGITYKVQIVANTTKLSTQTAPLKYLSPVSYYQENGWYKYTYGEAPTKQGLADELAKARKYFKDAFIVAFKNGEKIK